MRNDPKREYVTVVAEIGHLSNIKYLEPAMPFINPMPTAPSGQL